MTCSSCHFFRALKHPEPAFGLQADGVCFVHARASGRALIVNQDDGKTCKLYTDAAAQQALDAIHRHMKREVA